MILIILLLNFITLQCSATETNHSIKIQKIIPTFDRAGYPNLATIKSLITAKHLQKYRTNKIIVKKINGGLYSEKLFVAKIKQDKKKLPILFFKISKKSDSTSKLIKIKEGPIGKKFHNLNQQKRNINPINKKNIPQMVWLENVYSYQDPNGNQRNIEVTPAAQGKLIQDILDSENKLMIKEAGYALGKTLGTFHQLFMNYNDSDNPQEWKTMCHGDFSVKNSLFDPSSDKIYFIDNEGIKEGSITQDIKTILISLLMFQYLKKHFSRRWPLFLEYCNAFLKEYIATYPIKHQEKIALYIQQSLHAELNKKLYSIIPTKTSLKRTKFNEKEFKKMVYTSIILKK